MSSIFQQLPTFTLPEEDSGDAACEARYRETRDEKEEEERRRLLLIHVAFDLITSVREAIKTLVHLCVNLIVFVLSLLSSRFSKSFRIFK